jgi:hypothetical protein
MAQTRFYPRIRPAQGSPIVEDMRRVKIGEALDATSSPQRQPPVDPTMFRYTAVRDQNGNVTRQKDAWDAPAGKRQVALTALMDTMIALVGRVVSSRAGRLEVLARDEAVGFACLVTLPGSILAPTGLEGVLNEIRSAILQLAPETQIDCTDVRSIGQGSPVDQTDPLHLMTLRFLIRNSAATAPFDNEQFGRRGNNTDAETVCRRANYRVKFDDE